MVMTQQKQQTQEEEKKKEDKEEKMKKDMCVLCNKEFSKREEEMQLKVMIISTECCHMIHRNCLKETALKQISQSKKIVCPHR